uniref:Lysozyme n=1 Tax=Ditylenchus dipsaci TaxID=166011 RepID=A0A915DQ27_9BILA
MAEKIADTIDTIAPLSTQQLLAFKERGVIRFIARVSRSTGQLDTDGIQNMKNAIEAGIKVELYIFPKVNDEKNSPQMQAEKVIDALGEDLYNKVDRIWVDVEKDHFNNNKLFGSGWTCKPSNTSEQEWLCKKRNFVHDIVNTFQNHGLKVGIYTSKEGWHEAVGDYDGLKRLPLWWPRYNNSPNVGYNPFGGWELPMFHQYQGDVRMEITYTMESGVKKTEWIRVDKNHYNEPSFEEMMKEYHRHFGGSADIFHPSYSRNQS